MNSFQLEGRCAVVIGGTSGIGHAIALGLARAGVNVIPVSRSAEASAQTAQQVRSLGCRSLDAYVDVTQRASIEKLHAAVQNELGDVHVLVNCAGVTQRAPTATFSENDWNRIFDINLNGTLRACQVFGQSMIDRRRGRIINIASLSTLVAFQEVAAYCASKAAVGALTRSLAVEWAPYNVFVNAIAPGIFPTALNSAILESPRGKELKMRTPMQRFGQPEELITTALYLASDTSSFTTGQIVAVDGGFLASGVNQ
ncbi:MAG: SDR family oxidoreductase [Acidobacteria bacterium]|nr:SDR family oxidoreductase [Acidobacteriota bacterium]